MFKRPITRLITYQGCAQAPTTLFPLTPIRPFTKTPWRPSFFYETQAAYMTAAEAKAHIHKCVSWFVPTVIKPIVRINYDLLRTFLLKYHPELPPLNLYIHVLKKARVSKKNIAKAIAYRNRDVVEKIHVVPEVEPARIIKVVKKRNGKDPL